MLLLLGGPIFLRVHDLVTVSNPFIGVSLVCGIILPIVYFFYRNHGIRTYSFDKDGLVIDNIKIKWTEMISYRLKDDSPEFKILRIKTRTRGVLSIGHRKKFINKDDFEKFLRVFELRTQNLAASGIVIKKLPPIWDRPIGKVYGYVIIALLIVLGIGIFTFKHQGLALVYFLIVGGLSTPILLRVFKKNTAANNGEHP
jgi:energy-converting hydrogenase Eha subunit E